MGRKKKYDNLTDDEIKQKRKEYMKKYYMKKKHHIIDGNYERQEPAPPKIPPLKITHGEFVVSFN
jgi:hypothetical protein